MTTDDIVVGTGCCCSRQDHTTRLSDLTAEAKAVLVAALSLESERWQDGAVAAAKRILDTAAMDFAASVRKEAP